MSETKKKILIVFLLLLFSPVIPVIYFVDIIIASIIDELMITQKDVEEYGKEMQPQSGIVFPADTTFVNGYWVKNTFFQERGTGWKYTSKEPFQLPENAKVNIEKREDQTYYLKIGDIEWSSSIPFQLPVNLNRLYWFERSWYRNGETLKAYVKDLEAQGEKWFTESDFDRHEDWFGRMFETNITGATEYKKAKWMTNGFVFSASMLETPEQYYLYLDSHVPRSYELENPEEYGLSRNIDEN
jgi:hypothetical protein